MCPVLKTTITIKLHTNPAFSSHLTNMKSKYKIKDKSETKQTQTSTTKKYPPPPSPRNMQVCYRDGSPKTYKHLVTLRQNLLIKPTISSSHSMLTPCQPFLAMTQYSKMPGKVVIRVPNFKSLGHQQCCLTIY